MVGGFVVMLRHRHGFASELLSLVGKGVGVSAGIGILLTSSGAFAAGSANQLLLADVVVPTVTVPTTPVSNSPAPNTVPTSTQTSSGSGAHFTCENFNGNPTVMYYPDNQNGRGFAWAQPSDMGDTWTPQARCQAIAQRLEQYRTEGLEQMVTSKLNGYDIVGVTTDQVPGVQIVLTVPPGQDPQATRDKIFNNLTIAEAGNQTEAINTFTSSGGGLCFNNKLGQFLHLGCPTTNQNHSITSAPSGNTNIYLRPFLAPSDGGDGSLLGKLTSTPARSTPQPKPTSTLFHNH
jgi:hypothetical protein